MKYPKGPLMSEKIKIAYILTPITFGGSERVSLNFLKSVDRKKFDINPIIFLRPWETEPYFKVQLRKMGYCYSVLPMAIKELAIF